MLATRLLREPALPATRIVLIERHRQLGRGVAYARRDHDYLLNVPAGRMSADSRVTREHSCNTRNAGEPDATQPRISCHVRCTATISTS